MRATALVRPGVVIVARTCKSKYVSTSSLLFAGEQLSSLGKRAVERSLWLRVVRLTTLARCSRARVVDLCDLSQEVSPEGGAGTGKTAWVEKAVSKRSFDRGPCRVVFPGTHHMRDRRTTEMPVIVLGQRKIKTILCKRPSPAEREFRTVGLCTCLF